MGKIAFLAGVLMVAARLCPAATCVGGTLTSYIGLGSSGCTVGTSTLAHFELLDGTTGATEIAASGVLLSPVFSTTAPGLKSSVSVSSAAGTISESLFTYQISGLAYVGSSIALSGASETGDGAVTGLENFCAGGIFGPDGVSGCTGLNGGLVTVDGFQNQDSSMFAAASFISVTNDLTIDGGSLGSADGATLIDQFSTPGAATPEPASLLITGLGLAFVVARTFQFASARLSEDKERTHE